MQTVTASVEEQAQPLEGPKGIGGWLVLPIIHLVTTIVSAGINLFPVWQDWYGLLGLLFDPVDRWMFLPIVISTASATAIMSLAACALVMMYLRKRMLPRLMIIYYCLGLASALFDAVLIYNFPEFRESPGDSDIAQATGDLFSMAIVTLIWVPYFLVSKRVEATFVE